MPEEIKIAAKLSIREAGYDEYWLQDQIFENPACLDLGELDAIGKERIQSSGGRLDILLKNPEDDTMYEVEIMLGATDETHIIRTIEYWDNEKRRWPLRQHFAVLVAEQINRRYFNVIHLLSNSIPIIAIQVSLLQTGDTKSLSFSTVLDTYEEIDDGTSIDNVKYNREYWIKKSKWTLDTADIILSSVGAIFNEPSLNYVKNYVGISVSGYNYMWLHKRSNNKSLLGFRISPSFQDEAGGLLDANNIPYIKKPKRFHVAVDKSLVEKNSDLIKSLAELVKKTWESNG